MTSQTQDLVITNTSSIPPSNTITFGYVKKEDVKVELGTTEQNRQLKSYPSEWTITSDNKVQLISSLFSATGTYKLRISRQTDTSTPAHTFVVGSSIKAEDLNNTNKQALFAVEENTDSINSLAMGDASGAIQIDGSNIADNSINSDKIINLQVKDVDLSSHISDDSLRAVTTNHIRDNAVTTAKIANSTGTSDGVTTAKIADGAVTQVKLDSGIIFTPVGTVITYAGSTAPSGYLKANGDAIPNGSGTVQGVTANFSALYAVVGATLPDLRGEFIRGLDDSRGVDSGRSIRSTQSDENKQHNHSISVSGTTSNKSLTGQVRKIAETFAAQGTTSGIFSKLGSQTASHTPSGVDSSATGGFSINASHDHTFSASGTSGDQGSESRPRNVALLMCIKY